MGEVPGPFQDSNLHPTDVPVKESFVSKLLSVKDLIPFFRNKLDAGEFRFQNPDLGITITPINVANMVPGLPDDLQMMRNTVNDIRVREHIEDMNGTRDAETVGMARSIWKNIGERLRYTPRSASGEGLGVINLAVLDEDTLKDPKTLALHERVLKGKKLSGELAYYHAKGVKGNDVIMIDNQDANTLSQKTKELWLNTLTSQEFTQQNTGYEKAINDTIKLIDGINTGHSEKRAPVLTTRFGAGYATMLEEQFKAAQEVLKVNPEDTRFMLYVDTEPPNMESLRMLLPFGARIEGFCQYDAPNETDPNRKLTRVVLSQDYEGIRKFIDFAKPYMEKFHASHPGLEPPAPVKQPPYDTPDTMHPSLDTISAEIARMDVEAEPSRELARERVRDMYANLMKLRVEGQNGYTETDSLTIVADSAADLPALKVLAQEAASIGAHVNVVYYRSDISDNAELARQYLAPLMEEGILLKFFDYTGQGAEFRKLAMQQFIDTKPTVYMTLLSQAYELRRNLYKVANILPPEENEPELTSELYITGLELPTIDMASLCSEMFADDRETMYAMGNKLIDEFRNYSKIRFKASDGMDLTITAGNGSWVNEAANRFDLRPSDYQNDATLKDRHPSWADNPPGEICANVRIAEGTLVLYQLDTDVIQWALKHAADNGWNISDADKIGLVINTNDPIKMQVDDTGRIILDSLQSQSIRADILRKYLENQVQLDSRHENRPENAALKISEIGLGINRRANNPDDPVGNGRILSVLITEKMARIFHLAIGKSINDDGVEWENLSGSHIDNGLRNPNLRVFGIAENGEEILLSSTVPGEVGTMDLIFAQYGISTLSQQT